MLQLALFYGAIGFLVIGLILLIVGFNFMGTARKTWTTTHFNALAWTGGTQHHESFNEAKSEKGFNLTALGTLLLLVAAIIWPGYAWWVKLLAFLGVLLLGMIISLLMPAFIMDPIAIKLGVEQKPLTLKEKEELKKLQFKQQFATLVESQVKLERILRGLDEAQQADFMECCKTAMDDNAEDTKRRTSLRLISEYMDEAGVPKN